MLAFLSKYFMPQSLTWWTGIAMLLSGVDLDLAPSITALAILTAPLQAIWHGTPASALIAGGLVAIGLRSGLASAVEGVIAALVTKDPAP